MSATVCLIMTSTLLALALIMLDVHGRVWVNSLRWLARYRPRPVIPLPQSCSQLAIRPLTRFNLSRIDNPSAAIVYLYLSPKTRDHRDYFAEIVNSISVSVPYVHLDEIKAIVLFTDTLLSHSQYSVLRNLEKLGYAIQVAVLDQSYLSLPYSGPARPWYFVRCSEHGVGHPMVFNYRYLQMNAFRLVHLWRHSLVQSYDFLFLIDSDAIITKELPNIFKTIGDQTVHAHFQVYPDPVECVPSLELVEFFVKCAGIRPKTKINSLNYNLVYYGSMQLLRRDFFTSEQYTEFVKFLDRLGGIYTCRWSDQSIFYLALQIFVGREGVKDIRDVQWRHK